MREIDFHAHILPRCDHGSDGWETSRRQLKLARGAGVEIVCATSHFYGHQTGVEDFLQKRQRCYEELMAHAPKGSPRVLLGAEVLAFEGIERLPGLEALRLEGTRLLLLEMPFTHWSERLLDSVEALADNEDFRIVLAHVDRYDKAAVERLFQRNRFLGQVNTDSFKKIFGTRHLREWARQGRIVAVGSDIHGLHGGYEDWITCRVRNAKAWETIMERTNALLQGSL
jgi:protein-tyrosine phosphatase